MKSYDPKTLVRLPWIAEKLRLSPTSVRDMCEETPPPFPLVCGDPIVCRMGDIFEYRRKLAAQFVRHGRFIREPKPHARGGGAQPHQKPCPWTPEELADLKASVGVAKMSLLAGVPENMVRRWLKRAGVPRRGYRGKTTP